MCSGFRPGMLTVSGQSSSQVCVQVPPVLLQQILEAPPDQLHRSSGEVTITPNTKHTRNIKKQNLFRLCDSQLQDQK